MVIYDLECSAGHRFEGWFQSSEAFAEQKAQGLISCSICGNIDVTKLPTGGHILRKNRDFPDTPKQPQRLLAPHQTIQANMDPVVFMKTVQHYIATNFKNVGEQFADQAIKMHQGKLEAAQIYGTANGEQREQLDEEGVAYTSLPTLPDEFEN